MKKILLHGAINTSNFGDVLFAKIFYDEICHTDSWQPVFTEFPKYGVKEFVRKETGYDKHCSLFQQLSSDALLYISGGYFGDNKKSHRLNLRRLFRYAIVGIVMTLLGKDVLILGIGGGPLHSAINKKLFMYIMNRAKVITVRDKETADYFAGIGVTGPLVCTSDTALTIRNVPPIDEALRFSISKKTGKEKWVYFHLVAAPAIDAQIAKVVVPAINKFLREHSEYGLVVGFDGVFTGKVEELESVKCLENKSYFYSVYTSAVGLCSLLNEMSFIITPKLHVGIIGSSLGKSVVSFPEHLYKTKRFYEQIGEGERCFELEHVDANTAFNMMEKFFLSNIYISEELRNSADKNIEMLKDYLANHKCS